MNTCVHEKAFVHLACLDKPDGRATETGLAGASLDVEVTAFLIPSDLLLAGVLFSKSLDLPFSMRVNLLAESVADLSMALWSSVAMMPFGAACPVVVEDELTPLVFEVEVVPVLLILA